MATRMPPLVYRGDRLENLGSRRRQMLANHRPTSPARDLTEPQLIRWRSNGKRGIRADLVVVGNWRGSGVGLVPRIGGTFCERAGCSGLARLQGVERASAPTGIVITLDAKRILRDGCLRAGRGCHSAYKGHER
jgi:hypothetical protein